MPSSLKTQVLSWNQKQRTLIILYLIGFTTMLGIGIITPILPLYAQMIGATGLWIGMIFSVFAFSRTIFMPFIGRLSDSTGRRRFLLIGLAGYSLFSLLYIPAVDVVSLTIVRFFHGIAAAMVYPIANAYVADMAGIGEEGRVMGGFQSAALLGMSFGPLLGGTLVDLFTIDGAFLSLGGLALIAFILSLIILPEYHAPIRDVPPLKVVFFSKGMRIPILFFFCYTAAYTVFIVFLPVLGSVDHLAMTHIGLLIFIASLSMAAAQRFSGQMTDTVNRHQVLAAGAGGMALALLLMTLSHDLLMLTFSSFLLGTSLGMSLTAVSALAVIEGRELGQGSVEGVINTAQGIGIMICPIIFGLIMDTAGITVVFITAAIISAGMAFIMAMYGFKKPGTVE